METKTKTNGYVQRSAPEWQSIMTRYSQSGRSRAAFCRAEGISRSTFDVRHRKLESSKPAQEFVEMTPAAETSMGGWLVQIELPDGTIARLRG